MRILKKIPLLLFHLFVLSCLQAQPDSVALRMDHFDTDDVLIRPSEAYGQKVVSASRSLKSVEELPFTIHVITQEEILNNGYVTLVDVLKSIPGIRVSQPGSGLEGETFLMRGLLGNSYAKILINDQPIKPTGTLGMPIGAQLPVRQADRIEIIFGPAAAVYGADAAAGVINIITKNTDRPIFTRADLGLGTNTYTDLNVLFGGKVGKDKRVLHFTFYGSNTNFNNRRTNYDQDNLYNTFQYASAFGDTSYLESPSNYRGTLTEPTINNLPHLSRMIGIELKYRALRFSFNRMHRRDHSAIGLNPVAISANNPANFIGEDITRATFGIQKNKKNFGFSTTLSYVGYNMDARSSQTYVQNTLYRFFNQAIFQNVSNPIVADSIKNWVHNRYFSDSRYSLGSSLDLYLEQIFNIHPSPYYELILGFSARASSILPVTFYNRVPLRVDPFVDLSSLPVKDFPMQPFSQGSFGAGGFCQFYLTLKNLNFIAGLRYDIDDFYSGAFNPRIAALYKLSQSISLRGTYATAFRAPSPFYDVNTFFLQQDQLDTRLRTRQWVNIPKLNPEQTWSYEIGTRIKTQPKSKLSLFADVALFYTKTKDLISFTFDPNLELFGGEFGATIGYFNGLNTAVTLYGLQSQLRLDDLWPRYLLQIKVNTMFSQGEEILPFDNGKLDDLRMQPRFFGQAEVSFRPRSKLYLSFKNNVSGKWLRRSTVTQNQQSNFYTDGYYTLDLLTRLELSRHFQVYLKINNLFGKEYGGIGASGFIDDLFYNPQPLTSYIFGLSYNLD